jgi:haloacetate dehalogenase
MWRRVASTLSSHFTVVCADLRGHGDSGCPPSGDEHAPYAKRALAHDMVALMAAVGFERFAVVGHDRGGRVAYRLALDHAQRIDRLAVLDVLPVRPCGSMRTIASHSASGHGACWRKIRRCPSGY